MVLHQQAPGDSNWWRSEFPQLLRYCCSSIRTRGDLTFAACQGPRSHLKREKVQSKAARMIEGLWSVFFKKMLKEYELIS